MLVLSRRVGESFVIGDKIIVTVVRIAGGGVRLGIDAPNNCVVIRKELAEPLLPEHSPQHSPPPGHEQQPNTGGR